MVEIRPCGLGWAYCNGNCSTCQKTITTATTSTTPPNFVTGTSHYPVSNADRIRAMSDEELAEWICQQHNTEGDCDNCAGKQHCRMGHIGILDWLRSPVGGDGDE